MEEVIGVETWEQRIRSPVKIAIWPREEKNCKGEA